MTSHHLPRRVCSCLLLLGMSLALLKGCGVLPWSWPVVLAPFLILAAVTVGFLLFALAYAFLVGWRSARTESQQRKRNSYKLRL